MGRRGGTRGAREARDRNRALPAGPRTIGPATAVAVASALLLAAGPVPGTRAATTAGPSLPAPARTPATATTTAATSGGDEQWHHRNLRLKEAHQLTRGEGTVVAVVDGGVDGSHPKLVGQLIAGEGLGQDAAADGLRDDDPDGHGTAMAGLIAARSDVGDPAVWGVAPGARVLPLSTGVEANSAEVASAIRIAVDDGADVISLSLGSSGQASSVERRAVNYALAHDVVVVASAGNVTSGDATVNSPANIPGVIAVTGSDHRGRFWTDSVHGPEAVLAAPGSDIRSLVPTRVSDDGLDTGAGTSNSAAIVAGVAALVRARLPTLNAANVINRLIRTAVDMGPPGRDDEYGFGLVDPMAALTAQLPLVTANPLLATTVAQGLTGTGTAVSPGLSSGHGIATRTGPSAEAWMLMLGLAATEGALLGALAHVLFGARYTAMLERRRRRQHAATAFGPGGPPPHYRPFGPPPLVPPRPWPGPTPVRPAPTPAARPMAAPARPPASPAPTAAAPGRPGGPPARPTTGQKQPPVPSARPAATSSVPQPPPRPPAGARPTASPRPGAAPRTPANPSPAAGSRPAANPRPATGPRPAARPGPAGGQRPAAGQRPPVADKQPADSRTWHTPR